jgi:succinate dehydrogenase/fumarate reductase-like Fe-S protein
MKGRLHALALLALYFWRHWLLKVTFRYDRGGLARFRANYEREGLLPVPSTSRADTAVWMRCTACGLCDAVCPGAPDGPLTLSSLLGAASRDTSTAADAAADARRLPCEGCAACRDVCPVGIDVRNALEHLRSSH